MEMKRVGVCRSVQTAALQDGSEQNHRREKLFLQLWSAGNRSLNSAAQKHDESMFPEKDQTC